ncbi:MAG: PLP-dependent cysteine synthase family protein [Chitinophagaceae bacterium]
MEETIAKNILQTVGNTPLVKLSKIVPENCADIYVKLEYFNPTGSYKDRMALAIIEAAEARGDIKQGTTVVEFTGGSTGTSMAFICAVKGHHFKVICSDAFAKEKLKTMRLFGADLEIIESEGGRITPSLFIKMEERVRQIVNETGAYWTKQFYNEDAQLGYKKLGKEITDRLNNIDVFCAGVGTAGMLTGVSQQLKNNNKETRVIALEPASAAFISTGLKGSHRVEGVASGIVPPLLTKESYDEVRAIDENDARKTAKLLAAQEGIFAGTSSGLNVFAAIEIGKELGKGKTVVTVAADSGMKYLAGDLFD